MTAMLMEAPSRPSAPEDVLDEFRRALQDHDEASWAALIGRYDGLVRAWARRHPQRPAVLEDDDYLVNRAFERFWLAIKPARVADFHAVGPLLRYLQMCVGSAVADELRRQERAATSYLADDDPPLPGADNLELDLLDDEGGRELWGVVARLLPSDAERTVVYETIVLDRAPREVHQRYPMDFPTVADVYRVKRNALDRLRRSSELRHARVAGYSG